ncbi:MAG: UTP--glucose-1-phosphate uridylyltransferase [Akkermansiaceae bacterium]|nr:UTP--glucose-1-phosphate uridylyltransferase [Armatimonadota bacterium]
MNFSKAVITAAAPSQRSLPLQSIVDRDGAVKSVLSLLVRQAMDAGAPDVCIVVHPGDESRYAAAVGTGGAGAVHFVTQSAPRGYGHALWSAREFVGGEPFLHFVGDHIFLSNDPGEHVAERIAQVAREAGCAVSGIQPTRESLLPYFGTIGGQRVKGTQDRFLIERVIEKPTPTEAEQTLIVPGLRAGHYLCFMGTHVFTPAVLELLDGTVAAANENEDIPLSPVLDELAQREQYLAVGVHGRRFSLDMKYGLLMTQLALALSGDDRDEVLSSLCDLLAQREMK